VPAEIFEKGLQDAEAAGAELNLGAPLALDLVDRAGVEVLDVLRARERADGGHRPHL
jgi:hypothetical protein